MKKNLIYNVILTNLIVTLSLISCKSINRGSGSELANFRDGDIHIPYVYEILPDSCRSNWSALGSGATLLSPDCQMKLTYSIGDNPVVKSSFYIQNADVLYPQNIQCPTDMQGLSDRTVIRNIGYTITDPQYGSHFENLSLTSNLPYPTQPDNYYLDLLIQTVNSKGNCSQVMYEYFIVVK